MTEPAFREIQLTKKQLVFLFMASVVLAAVVFLLGVSLGRRLPTSTHSAIPSAQPAADETAPAEMPPATVLTADDRKYATDLQGSGVVPPAVPVPPPATAAAAPAATTPPAATPAASTPPAAKSAEPARGASAAAASASAPTAKPAAPAPASGGWYVQVNAFRSRENAESEVRQLKAKGHAAFVAPGGSLFRVRVGPFAERSGADAASTKLRQDGFKPSITR